MDYLLVVVIFQIVIIQEKNGKLNDKILKRRKSENN